MPSCLGPHGKPGGPKERLLGDYHSTLINVLGDVSPPCWHRPLQTYTLNKSACNFTVIFMSDPFCYLVTNEIDRRNGKRRRRIARGPWAGVECQMFALMPDGTPIIYWVFYFPHIILLMFDGLDRTIKTDKKIYDVVPQRNKNLFFLTILIIFSDNIDSFASISNISSQEHFEEFWCSEHRNYGLKASKAN